ncbi:MAG: methylase [Bacteroidetes bacterium]|nr:methylase [Bacteroidota bacterium]
MKNEVFKFLEKSATQPKQVDRLIISAFLSKNNITVTKNKFLQDFIIQEKSKKEYEILTKFISTLEKEVGKFGAEELIEIFEFVISPADRIVNGAVYTPLYIREYIVEKTFFSKKESLSETKIADISCGCGGFLYTAATQLKKRTKQTYFDIFKNQIFGLDIQPYSITRTKLLLTLLAVLEGEDSEVFHFNLFKGDSLTFQWDKKIQNFFGFDIILGNPPYVGAKHLSEITKKRLAKWEVCKSGNPDLYIPFFQIGIELLQSSGILGFITMNSFFKSLNGRALRAYFQRCSLKFDIIDFGAEQVFRAKNTYTCICLIEKSHQDFMQYVKTNSKDLPKDLIPTKIKYAGLNSKKGWNLQDIELITKIESTGNAFGKLFKTRHGIATLRNEVYIFRPVDEDDDFYYLQNGSLYPIEKDICKDIVNSNKLSSSVRLNDLKEKVIFPYSDEEKPRLLNEDFFRTNYPHAYFYLAGKKKLLKARDKGSRKYEKWFAFGRTQSLEKVKNKMFFPKMSNKTPSYIINTDENLLFYNGCAIIGSTQKELAIIKKLLETKLFWYYIERTSKPYSAQYYSLNGNYINNFGICELSPSEKKYVLSERDKNKLDAFFEKKYNISLP